MERVVAIEAGEARSASVPQRLGRGGSEASC